MTVEAHRADRLTVLEHRYDKERAQAAEMHGGHPARIALVKGPVRQRVQDVNGCWYAPFGPCRYAGPRPPLLTEEALEFRLHVQTRGRPEDAGAQRRT